MIIFSFSSAKRCIFLSNAKNLINKFIVWTQNDYILFECSVHTLVFIASKSSIRCTACTSQLYLRDISIASDFGKTLYCNCLLFYSYCIVFRAHKHFIIVADLQTLGQQT